jgi:prepilin-type N-terminal cleavage/methylation domain-containing protein
MMTMARHNHIPAICPDGCGRGASRGFTFTEVLFAVVILGIGFIMLAAMFPVALSQTKLTVNESAGIQAATGASAAMNSVFDGSDWSLCSASVSINGTGTLLNESLPYTVLPALVPTGVLQSFVPGQAIPLGSIAGVGSPPMPSSANGYFTPGSGGDPTPSPNAISLNQIVPSDPRYAWTILYRRDLVASYANSSSTTQFVPSPYAQLICIPVVTGVTGQFAQGDVPTGTYSNSGSVRPQQAQGSINFDTNSNTYYFEAPSGTTLQGAPYGPGSYLVVNDDQITNNNFHGLLNGNVYRLGSVIPVNNDPDTSGNLEFYFAPGWDFQPQVVYSPVPNASPGSTTIDGSGGAAPNSTDLGSISFYVVGRYSQNGVYSGNSQEVGAFVTTVKVQ